MPDRSLAQIHAALLALRAALDPSRAEGIDLDSLRGDVDRLAALVEAESARDTPATAPLRYERLQTLGPAFEALHRKWSDLRDSVAAEAAEEIRTGLNLEGGWRHRWKYFYDVAWALRKEVEAAASEAKSRSSQSLRPSGLQSERRGADSDTLIALDMRYADNMPLTKIAGLVGMSPAAVQMRIVAFEDVVLLRFGLQTVAAQVPDGWRVTSSLNTRIREARTVLLRRGGPGPTEVEVVIRAVKADREAPLGRPRTMRPYSFAKGRDLPATIWAVVLEADAEVRFIWMNDLEPDALDRQSLSDIARNRGHKTLAGALNEAGAGQTMTKHD